MLPSFAALVFCAYDPTTPSTLWRGSLLPLGRAAAPKKKPATQSSGSKLPRHKVQCQFWIPELGYHPSLLKKGWQLYAG
ncbi:hypothetical protein BJ917_1074 [Pseudomonas sp. WPR_5_2]|nr:hypothetical protein BJ917_1074 [Pseudomonas sp. WPR_5_2]